MIVLKLLIINYYFRECIVYFKNYYFIYVCVYRYICVNNKWEIINGRYYENYNVGIKCFIVVLYLLVFE